MGGRSVSGFDVSYQICMSIWILDLDDDVMEEARSVPSVVTVDASIKLVSEPTLAG